MHMNSAPHLLNEDRRDYERILDEALRSAPHHPELTSAGRRLNPEQLRTMALDATPLITAAAAPEYARYVKIREELRDPSRPATSSSASSSASASASASASEQISPETDPDHSPTPAPSSGPMGLAISVGEAGEAAGAGLTAILAVLAPLLAGTAAVIFLIIGYVLKMISPEPAFADTLLAAGWFFGALTAAGIMVAGTGLLVTALRNGANSLRAGGSRELTEEVARARQAWCEALLERGLLPFLRDALADPTAPPQHSTPGAPGDRMPHLGFDSPHFSSPDIGPPPSSKPTFSSPDFTSPDFGGPEHQPD
ncbi:hypothetical protein [Streptomyces sp. KLOTTS4A1]|uniref:hypothetical protein n=1 Tax=Streptomyces sp. KLOTTS4A1 TaxID=3390996 RepID=UPI0039F59215